jgi:hypothetical protein
MVPAAALPTGSPPAGVRAAVRPVAVLALRSRSRGLPPQRGSATTPSTQQEGDESEVERARQKEGRRCDEARGSLFASAVGDDMFWIADPSAV